MLTFNTCFRFGKRYPKTLRSCSCKCCILCPNVDRPPLKSFVIRGCVNRHSNSSLPTTHSKCRVRVQCYVIRQLCVVPSMRHSAQSLPHKQPTLDRWVCPSWPSVVPRKSLRIPTSRSCREPHFRMRRSALTIAHQHFGQFDEQENAS